MEAQTDLIAELAELDVDGVVLIVADSLRWDFASTMMFGQLFREETWGRARTHGTYTAQCMPTILTGDADHGNKNFLRELSASDSLAHGRDVKMFSEVFGGEDAVLRFENIEAESYSDSSEYRVLEWLNSRTALPELTVYHSLITHWPFGMGNGGDSEFREMGEMFEDGNAQYEWSRENYRKGVTAMRQRVQQIEKKFGKDHLILLTADHGEMLQERGLESHVNQMDGYDNWGRNWEIVDESVEWNPVDKNQWSTEVPVVLNRDVDFFPTEKMTLEDIRPIVEIVLSGELNYDPYESVDVEITPYDEVREDGVSDGVKDRLEDLGYR